MFSHNPLALLTVAASVFAGHCADVQVYFGCGCFWHVQFAFVGLEERLLNRAGDEITARTAYAGSKQVGSGEMVCYHNSEGVADYAQMGHAEAVTVSVPEDHFDAFVSTFWEICPHGNRKDAMDHDHQYRSVIGIPGGLSSPLAAKFSNDAAAAQLMAGSGGDADTFGTNTVWVYDSDEFPATTAEKYHQFHDDFMRSAYDRQYHALQKFAKKSGCPGDAAILTAVRSHAVSEPLLSICLFSLAGLSVVWTIAKRKRTTTQEKQDYMPM